MNKQTINAFQWILSEMWDIYVLSTLGYYDLIEDKLEKVVTFLKENGITESSMSLDEEINEKTLKEFINKFDVK